jgi:glucose/arabinose dehydrogenase
MMVLRIMFKRLSCIFLFLRTKIRDPMKKRLFIAVLTVLLVSAAWLSCTTTEKSQTSGNAGLTLPSGFSAQMLIDSIGKARHLAVSPQGDIFVKLEDIKDSVGIVVLKEGAEGTTVKASFGDFGGTGAYIKNGYLYASSNTTVYRFWLNENGEVVDPANPEVIVSGLIDRDQHASKSIVLDNDGNLYVNIGAPSNSCQQEDREVGSLGMMPCPVLDSAGGIWRFRADKANQTYADGKRYATGLRNVVGLDWNQELNQLFVMQHGRDQLNSIFPDKFTVQQSAELPAECMFAITEGDHCGWPFTYYDPAQKKKILSPEYGGDGQKEGGAEFKDPVAVYPAHMGPNGLLFYTGDQFPERYKNGAFIAFHGSWNRAPEPQKGFFVVFQPFNNGKPDGEWEVFADGFSGSPANTASGSATHRPCGLAEGPDGSLYVSDDKGGAIYKISYAPPAP